MKFASHHWRLLAVVIAAVGLLAVGGYFLINNRQIMGALAARTATSPSAGHKHDEHGEESGHAHGEADHEREEEKADSHHDGEDDHDHAGESPG